MFKIPVFKCDWIDSKNGIKVDDLRWSVVLSTPQQGFLERDEGDDLMGNSTEHYPIISFSFFPQVESFDVMDDFDAICIRGVLARTMVPIRYNSWRYVPIQLKDSLWDTIEDFREVQKERRKKDIYNHHLSMKEYAGLEDEKIAATSNTKIIDRRILSKKTIEKKDDTYDEVVIPVVEKIDKMLKESRESDWIFRGNNDILTEALGTPEYNGRVRAKGKSKPIFPFHGGSCYAGICERILRVTI
ncbi:hypothetical protein CK203_102320 [Vitis vinifera]|uniref:DUF4216 domain-containing protein n=1 Tax=Vitis vinifera TaxID=29760 RepID=A0A438BR30_VITVI|nr:hypothetical protein CK203_102320 [Vitis vinifera]